MGVGRKEGLELGTERKYESNCGTKMLKSLLRFLAMSMDIRVDPLFPNLMWPVCKSGFTMKLIKFKQQTSHAQMNELLPRLWERFW